MNEWIETRETPLRFCTMPSRTLLDIPAPVLNQNITWSAERVLSLNISVPNKYPSLPGTVWIKIVDSPDPDTHMPSRLCLLSWVPLFSPVSLFSLGSTPWQLPAQQQRCFGSSATSTAPFSNTWGLSIDFISLTSACNLWSLVQWGDCVVSITWSGERRDREG